MKLFNAFNRRNRILLRELVVTDFKLRYQGSVLGYLWSLLKPLMLFAIMYTVFVHFMRFGEGVPHFAVALLLGIVMWTFFIEATSQGMQAIVMRGDLIRKISFPKYIIVISSTISALINLILNLIVVGAFMAFDGVDIGWSALLAPVSIAILYAFSLGLAFLLSASYVKYRDITHIWDIFIQGLFYATPIIYPIQLVTEKGGDFAAKLLLMNPIAVLIQNTREQILGTESTITPGQIYEHDIYITIPYVFMALVIIIGIIYFKKSQGKFAENV